MSLQKLFKFEFEIELKNWMNLRFYSIISYIKSICRKSQIRPKVKDPKNTSGIIYLVRSQI